jgi:hypothetical protein
MELIFSSSALDAFNALTAAARGCVLSQEGNHSPLKAAGVVQLLEAAVRFTIRLAIAAAERDQDKARRTWDLVTGQQSSSSLGEHLQPACALEDELLAKLAMWRDEEGILTLPLWTHDICCVIGALKQAALRYAYPQPLSSDAAVKHAVEVLPRNLTVAAVAFTVQLALEETKRDASEMRFLEAGLIAELEPEGLSWGRLEFGQRD